MKQALASTALTLLAPGTDLSAPKALAADDSFALAVQDRRFEPAQLEVPAGKRLTLATRNLDPAAEEFESRELKCEEIIAGSAQATIRIGPLKPGRYQFVGEYHEGTALGQIVAK